MAMPLSSHTTAGAGRLGTLLRSQPEGGKRTADLYRPAPWTLSGCRPGCVYRRFNKSEDCLCPKSACPPGALLALEQGAPMPVMIGVDPHKATHTAAVLDEHGCLLGQQRVPATLD